MTTELQIDQLIAEYDDWRGERLTWFRDFVIQNAPELEEAIKWGVGVFVYKNTPVIAYSGFKDFTKFNFFMGAGLPDPQELFNSGLDSVSHRSINMSKDDVIDELALKDVIKNAVAAVIKKKI
jgi:hypothetical protein